MLTELAEKIRRLLFADIREIVLDTRSNMQVVEEKANGDSATVADLKIGELLGDKLTEWLPGSLVVEEEHFNQNIYDKIDCTRYVWIVDPIDGTKAFRTKGNNEYCVAIALMDNFVPVLSFVYAPEYKVGGLLFEAEENGAKINGEPIRFPDGNNALRCINHVHRDTVLNENEEKIEAMCETSDMIRAYDGHSTLLQICLVAADNGLRVFTRRGANIWDIVQGAYVVVKAGGSVFYEDGTDIFPIDFGKLSLGDERLVMPYIIASSVGFKERYKLE